MGHLFDFLDIKTILAKTKKQKRAKTYVSLNRFLKNFQRFLKVEVVGAYLIIFSIALIQGGTYSRGAYSRIYGM